MLSLKVKFTCYSDSTERVRDLQGWSECEVAFGGWLWSLWARSPERSWGNTVTHELVNEPGDSALCTPG